MDLIPSTREARVVDPVPGDARAWVDNPQPSRSTECEEGRTNSLGSLLHGAPWRTREWCLVWRLAGCFPCGMGGFETFRAASRAAPQSQNHTQPGHDSRRLSTHFTTSCAVTREHRGTLAQPHVVIHFHPFVHSFMSHTQHARKVHAQVWREAQVWQPSKRDSVASSRQNISGHSWVHFTSSLRCIPGTLFGESLLAWRSYSAIFQGKS